MYVGNDEKYMEIVGFQIEFQWLTVGSWYLKKKNRSQLFYQLSLDKTYIFNSNIGFSPMVCV